MARSGVFLLEAYLPRSDADGPVAAASRARQVAAEMRCEGASVRVLRSFFLPEDELWFCLYEAPSTDEVVEAGRRAQLTLGRIQPAVDVEPSAGTSRVSASRRTRLRQAKANHRVARRRWKR